MAESPSTGIYRVVQERIPADPDALAAWLCEHIKDTTLEAHLERARELATHILALDEAGTLETELAKATLPRQQHTIVRPIAVALARDAHDLLRAMERLRYALRGGLPPEHVANVALAVGRLFERVWVRHVEPWAEYGRQDVSRLKKASRVEAAQAKRQEARRLYEKLRPGQHTRKATYALIAKQIGCPPRTIRLYLDGYYTKDEKSKKKSDTA